MHTHGRPHIYIYIYLQRRRSHNAHYALCVGHQVLRGHHKIGNKKNPHSSNNYTILFQSRNIRHLLGMYITKQAEQETPPAARRGSLHFLS